jgi:hypothetical protein
MAYWGVTAIFSLIFFGGGTSHLMGTEAMTAVMTNLGYPLYVMKIIGTAKVLGAIALLIPAQPFLKEWAYAGFAIDLIGAVASHGFVGDPIAESLPPMGLLLLGATSYALRPASRRLVPAPADA